MDPKANLKEQIRLAELIQDCEDNSCSLCGQRGVRLAELVSALSEWITERAQAEQYVAWKRALFACDLFSALMQLVRRRS